MNRTYLFAHRSDAHETLIYLYNHETNKLIRRRTALPVFQYIYIYIYIYNLKRERTRERERERDIYIYI